MLYSSKANERFSRHRFNDDPATTTALMMMTMTTVPMQYSQRHQFGFSVGLSPRFSRVSFFSPGQESSLVHALHNIYVRISRLHSNDSEMAADHSSSHVCVCATDSGVDNNHQHFTWHTSICRITLHHNNNEAPVYHIQSVSQSVCGRFLCILTRTSATGASFAIS